MSFKSEFSSSKGWNAIDTNIKLTRSRGKSFMNYLKKNDVHTIIRYYASSRRAKTISKEEAQLICDNGFNLLPVYQDIGRSPSQFTKTKGKEAGKNAMDFVDYIGQPDGSTILFAVDADFSDSQITKSIVPYFEGVKDVLGDRIRMGAYGPGEALKQLQDAGLIEVPWLSMSRAFNGTKDFFYNKDWAMRQVPPDKTFKGSIYYDQNVMKWSPERIGVFKLGEPMKKYEDVPVASKKPKKPTKVASSGKKVWDKWEDIDKDGDFEQREDGKWVQVFDIT